MSYIKRALEDLIYELGPDRCVEGLIEVGFDEDTAQEFYDAYFGED